MGSRLGRVAKTTVRAVLPLSVRKRLAVVIGHQQWLKNRYYWTMELLRDMAERDPNGFHRFLWGHHLAYAETYEADRRLGGGQLHPTRELLLDELKALLDEDPVEGGVQTVLDVGCSLGYVLRRMETSLFPGARRLDGIDIDEYAIDHGAAYLERDGSGVRLAVADMSTVDQVFGAEPYDVVLSAGVLMYLREEDAQRVVSAMLNRTRHVLVLTGLAHPELDNGRLDESSVRERDGTFIHNLDAMVLRAGGNVLRRRWDGARQVEGNTIYFVFASPGAADAAEAAASSVSAAVQP